MLNKLQAKKEQLEQEIINLQNDLKVKIIKYDLLCELVEEVVAETKEEEVEQSDPITL